MWFHQDDNEPKKGNTSTENLSPEDYIPVDGGGGSSIIALSWDTPGPNHQQHQNKKEKGEPKRGEYSNRLD